MYKVALVLLLIGFKLQHSLIAQDEYSIVNNSQFWTEANIRQRLTSKVSTQFDIQYSRQSGPKEFAPFKYNSQLAFRVWFIYNIKNKYNFSVFAGDWYNYPIPALSNRRYNEIRFAFQVARYDYFGRFRLMNRSRLENRNLQGYNETYYPTWRIRYQIRSYFSLSKTHYSIGSLYLLLMNEIFIKGTSRLTGERLFDQNRIFIGLGYILSKSLTIEAGYFNQFQLRSFSNIFDANHVIQITFAFENMLNRRKQKVNSSF